MYKPTFLSADDEEQFNEKVRLIAEEELKDIKRKQFIDSIQRRISHYRPVRKEIVIDDYDYQFDIDTMEQDYKVETIYENN